MNLFGFQKEDAAQNCQTLREKVQLHYQNAQRLKWQTLKSIREEILQCDQTTRACTCAYFQTLSQLWAPIPNQVMINFGKFRIPNQLMTNFGKFSIFSFDFKEKSKFFTKFAKKHQDGSRCFNR